MRPAFQHKTPSEHPILRSSGRQLADDQWYQIAEQLLPVQAPASALVATHLLIYTTCLHRSAAPSLPKCAQLARRSKHPSAKQKGVFRAAFPRAQHACLRRAVHAYRRRGAQLHSHYSSTVPGAHCARRARREGTRPFPAKDVCRCQGLAEQGAYPVNT